MGAGRDATIRHGHGQASFRAARLGLMGSMLSMLEFAFRLPIFATTQQAEKVPKAVQDLFARGRARITTLLNTSFDPRRYLAEANESAIAAVEALAAKIGLKDWTPIKPASIEISWRERRITWVFKYHTMAVWTAILAKVILQHEYLSHILPRTDSPLTIVREGWLMWTLQREVSDLSRDESEVFEHVRRQKSGYANLEVFRGLGAVGEAMLIKRPTLYWALTRDLLAAPSGLGPAKQADVVLNFLMDLTPRSRRDDFLEDRGLTGLESLYKAVTRRQG